MFLNINIFTFSITVALKQFLTFKEYWVFYTKIRFKTLLLGQNNITWRLDGIYQVYLNNSICIIECLVRSSHEVQPYVPPYSNLWISRLPNQCFEGFCFSPSKTSNKITKPFSFSASSVCLKFHPIWLYKTVEGKMCLCTQISTGEARKSEIHIWSLQKEKKFVCSPGMLGGNVVYSLVILCFMLCQALPIPPRILCVFIPDLHCLKLWKLLLSHKTHPCETCLL